MTARPAAVAARGDIGAPGAPGTTGSSIHPRDFGLVVGARPVRRIKPRTARPSMPGWFPTLKGTLDSLRTESLPELDALGHYEVNPDVVLMAAQPHHLVHYVRDGRGRLVRRLYTPDFALLTRDGGIVVVEVKPASVARGPEWRAKEALLREAYERDHMVDFVVVTDEALDVEPRRTNVAVMLMHRPIWPDPEAGVAMRERVAAAGLPNTVGALLRRVRLPTDQPHADRGFTALVGMAIAGEVDLDLGVPLGDETVVRPGVLAGWRP